MAKASKIVDKITDTTNKVLKSKTYQKITQPFKDLCRKSIASGTASVLKGKSFGYGFMNEYIASLGSGYGEVIANFISDAKKLSDEKSKTLKVICKTTGNVLASSLKTFVEEMENSNEKDWENIAVEVAKSAGVAILSSVGGEYIDAAIDMANEAGSVANMLMEYDESMGKAMKTFFKYLFIVLSA